MGQRIQCIGINELLLADLARELNIKKYFLVCGTSFYGLKAAMALSKCGVSYEAFSDFTPNPVYGDVCKGVQCFLNSGCDAILAIGGGSAIDVAKCISIFSELPQEQDFLQQEYRPRKVPLIAVPTTAGTGSESTGFAVIYRNGEKISVTSDFILPDVALLDSSLLFNLPDYYKKSAMMDALCQALESWWSVKSTRESIGFARQAVQLIRDYGTAYLEGNETAAEKVLKAANLAGHAIHITQTTAPHAMSYKMTTLYGLAHGHAVALGFSEVWKYMQDHLSDCIDKRGQDYLMQVFQDMAVCMGYENAWMAAEGFAHSLKQLELLPPQTCKEEQLSVLVNSVNVERMQNNPVWIGKDWIKQIYYNILFKSQKEL